MGYYVSQMIGIRTGGVFSGKTDMKYVTKEISKVIKELKDTDNEVDMGDDPTHCMSKELEAHKGSYIVLAGVFNYWTWERSSEFSKRLSKVFQTEVMHACWNEENGQKNFEVFLDGKPVDEVNENPIGSIIRRVS